ncbi:transposase domain-containing protein [Streptomyces sp. ITFR-6]|uniref:transposase domain-containing protein n=1 Tax=Streptomyces sp. ITFR-6 TaxID=3075197 RepID=UPI002889AA7F|nr:transposase domain-containing protein [Streptomyces sp. ITFR-6]WNI28258.1 transposase domain-containing protein [Streptomyces sp. ITFR-6]
MFAVATGPFAPGHLGELTQVVPFELVDAVLEETGCVQRRLRDLPSRVGVYFLLAMCLFAKVGYRLVWNKLTAALAVSAWRSPGRPRRPCVTCGAGSVRRRSAACSRS